MMDHNIYDKKKFGFVPPTIESETIETLSQKLLQTTAELMETNQKLAKLQKEREEMLSNISHDLRAPITAIRSAIDYLTSGQQVTGEDLQSSLALIDRRTTTLENLIQDMYYLFCVEDSSRKLDLQTIPAIPFLEEYFYDAIVDSRYDSHDMQLKLPRDCDTAICIDIQKMIRVLDNLMTNAAKYSPSDSTITLEAHADFSKHRLYISVIDNGNGIPPEAVPHIFNRTYTVSSARTPGATSGSGLGLSIAKAIIERHDGTITCESELGKGCVFTISLPIFS